MAGQSRKWMILVATIWIQAFTGTNFDFSEYSSLLKSVLGISQVQLNYLATANDMGKLFGWSSGLALAHLPLWIVMFIAAFMGLVGYGLQWLVIKNIIALPYFVLFLNFKTLQHLSESKMPFVMFERQREAGRNCSKRAQSSFASDALRTSKIPFTLSADVIFLLQSLNTN